MKSEQTNEKAGLEAITMQIREVLQITCHRVTTDEKDYREYTRYGPNSWTVTMGESDEQVYDCGELEAEFQRFMSPT